MCALPWVSQLGYPNANIPGAGAAGGLRLLASGLYVPINGTGTIAQLVLPGDGVQHVLWICGRQSTTVTQTGGTITYAINDSGSGTGQVAATLLPGAATGGAGGLITQATITANALGSVTVNFPTTVTLLQGTAMSAGAAVVNWAVFCT